MSSQQQEKSRAHNNPHPQFRRSQDTLNEDLQTSISRRAPVSQALRHSDSRGPTLRRPTPLPFQSPDGPAESGCVVPENSDRARRQALVNQPPRYCMRMQGGCVLYRIHTGPYIPCTRSTRSERHAEIRALVLVGIGQGPPSLLCLCNSGSTFYKLRYVDTHL